MTIQTENKTPESVTPAIEVTAPTTKKDVQTKLVKAVAKTMVNKVANKKAATAKTIEAKTTKTKAVRASAAPKTQASPSPKPSPKPSKVKLETALKKPEKIKMERDSFTIPKDEYAQIANLKKRLEVLGKPAKKSELLRAGLKLLANMDDTMLQASMAAIPTIKTGRPKM